MTGEPAEEADQESAVIETTPETAEIEEPIALGLPGEESQETPPVEETTSLAGAPDEKGEKPTVEITEPLKTIHEERFIIDDIAGELIEDNY